ncbi:hypothetical protein CBR_g3750 [Chara braunii]|uniref:Uncharacterized protein n=1 Tax=Chara braunii TaxID=69332 RepID=A0A388KG68_CHABU|nr:hypothetical protein CBR_g3750 [Chara braunii]|eukprot:GBG69052.1 hypothetical protein CBR_g3750 [Chara braunii]
MNGSCARSDEESRAPKRARSEDAVKSPQSICGSGGGGAAASAWVGTDRALPRREPTDRVQVRREPTDRGEKGGVEAEAELSAHANGGEEEVDDSGLPRVAEVREMAKKLKSERISRVKELVSQIESLEFQLSIAREKLKEADTLWQQVEATGGDNRAISPETMLLLKRQLENRWTEDGSGGKDKDVRRDSMREREKGVGAKDVRMDERVRQGGGGAANDVRPREEQHGGSGRAAAMTGRPQTEPMPRVSTAPRERREDSGPSSRPSTGGNMGRSSEGMPRSSSAAPAAVGPKPTPVPPQQPSSARVVSAAVQQNAAIARGSPHSSQPSPPPPKRPRIDPPPMDGPYAIRHPSETVLIPQVNLSKEPTPLSGLRPPKIFPCGHKRKMRTLVFNPADPEQMLTRAVECSRAERSTSHE